MIPWCPKYPDVQCFLVGKLIISGLQSLDPRMICLVVIGLTVCGLMSSSIRVNAAAATAAFLLVGISFSVSWLQWYFNVFFRSFLDGSRSLEACSKHGTCKQFGSGHPVIRLPTYCCYRWCCQRDSDKEDIERGRERERDFAVCNIVAFLLAR